MTSDNLTKYLMDMTKTIIDISNNVGEFQPGKEGGYLTLAQNDFRETQILPIGNIPQEKRINTITFLEKKLIDFLQII